jgi:DNA-binding transcriptional MerR regulator
MTYVSISEAAKLAGISRQHLYKKYIQTGEISVERHYEVPKIQISELLRVFGELKTETTVDRQVVDNSLHDMTLKNVNDYSELQSKVKALEAENRQLQARLADKDEHLQDLREAMKLIEHKPAEKKKSWWFDWR